MVGLTAKGEYVWNSAKTTKTLLHLPCDVEGHIGKDNRTYLLDCARLWPPATPRSGVKGDFLVNLLRPEFVKSSPIPLSPDSFSGFGLENKQKHNDEIRQATTRLEQEVVPEYASKIDEHYLASSITYSYSTSIIENLLSDMHRHGINFRYLGMLRSKISCEELRSYILTEIVARTTKTIIRREMRALQSSDQESYVQLLVDYLNKVYGRSGETTDFWHHYLLKEMLKRYVHCMTNDEQYRAQHSNRSIVDIQWGVLFLRLQTLLGVKFQLDCLETIAKDYGTPGTKQRILDYPSELILRVEDVEQIYPIVKHVHRIFFEEGTALSKMAITQSSDDLFSQAEERYKESLQSKPNDYRALSNWGLSILMQAINKMNMRANESEVDKLFKSAEEKFQVKDLIYRCSIDYLPS